MIDVPLIGDTPLFDPICLCIVKPQFVSIRYMFSGLQNKLKELYLNRLRFLLFLSVDTDTKIVPPEITNMDPVPTAIVKLTTETRFRHVSLFPLVKQCSRSVSYHIFKWNYF